MIRDFSSTSGAYSGTGEHTESSVAQGVECCVSHCVYNKKGELCTAGHIQIGPTNAATTGDTVCATFKKQ